VAELIEDNTAWLSEPFTGHRDIIPITYAMYALYTMTPWLQKWISLDNDQERLRLVAWWILFAKSVFPAVQDNLSESQKDYLFETTEVLSGGVKIPRILSVIGACPETDLSGNKLFNIYGKEPLHSWGRFHIFLFRNAMDQVTSSYREYLLEQSTLVKQDTIVPINWALYALWLGRTDLQALFDLETVTGRRGLVAWWLGTTQEELEVLKLTQEQRDWLREATPEVEQDTLLPISRALYGVWQGRADLQKLFDLHTVSGRRGLVKWWLDFAQGETDVLKLTQEQKAWLREASPEVEQDTSLTISRALHGIWLGRPDLVENFDLSCASGRQAFVNWWNSHGKFETQHLSYLWNDCSDQCGILKNENGGDKTFNNKKLDEKLLVYSKDVGLNIVGFARGELGIGEDVRMAAKSCLENQYPFSIFETPISLQSRNTDESFAAFITKDPCYDINVFFLPATETLRTVMHCGNELVKNRYNIGGWQWELPVWPEKFSFYYKCVDEIWASSLYTKNAFQSTAPVPVFHIPHAVHIPELPDYQRDYFGLPNDMFLFLFVFDGLSRVERKNPYAVVQSFLAAFPRKQYPDVRLVMKTMNLLEQHPVTDKIRAAIEQDDRIIVVNRVLSRLEVLALIRCCDAFVSLHRAEGFGRVIAEAMLLSRPVIVSNYSGNVDFTTSETAFVVDGRMIDIHPEEYMFGEGQQWFDPDIEQAAVLMRHCVEKRDDVMKKVVAAKNLIETEYSPLTVGRLYEKRLKEIGVDCLRNKYVKTKD